MIPIAVCHDPIELQTALRLRADAMNFSRETIDEITGLADGHSNKLLCDPPAKNFGPVSLFLMVRGLGLAVALIEDEAMMEKLRRRPIRVRFNVRKGASHWRNAKAFARAHDTLARLGREGGLKSVAMLTPEELRAKLSKAARARWRKWRERKLQEQADQRSTNGLV
jgi:hypothetical protein